jgi:hypothetical protein
MLNEAVRTARAQVKEIVWRGSDRVAYLHIELYAHIQTAYPVIEGHTELPPPSHFSNSFIELAS